MISRVLRNSWLTQTASCAGLTLLRTCAFARAPKNYVPVEYACFEGNDKNLLLMTNTDISGIRVNVP